MAVDVKCSFDTKAFKPFLLSLKAQDTTLPSSNLSRLNETSWWNYTPFLLSFVKVFVGAYF